MKTELEHLAKLLLSKRLVMSMLVGLNDAKHMISRRNDDKQTSIKQVVKGLWY